MNRKYTSAFLAFALVGYGGAVQAQDNCENNIDSLEDRLDRAEISDEMADSIREMLDGAKGQENCQAVIVSVERTLANVEQRGASGSADPAAQPSVRQQAPAAQNRPGQSSNRGGSETAVENRPDAASQRAGGAASGGIASDARARSNPNASNTAEREYADSDNGMRISEQQALEFVDETLLSATGDDIGEIDEIIRRADGQLYATIDVGGFLGIGETEKVVPLSELRLNADGKPVLNMTQEQLEALPDFDEDEFGGEELAD